MADIYVTTAGNDTTGTGAVGAPYATPGKAAGIAVAGDRIALKSGTYTLTSSTANVSGGKVSLANGVKLEGYATTVGDLGTPPVISAGAITSITVVAYGGDATNQCAVINIKVDGNSGAGVTGFADGSAYGAAIYLCIAVNCVTGFNSVTHAYLCSSSACTTGFAVVGGSSSSYGDAVFCDAAGGTTCFSGGVRSGFYGCIADSPSGVGFSVQYEYKLVNCVAYGCGSDGFNSTAYPLGTVANCIAVNNTGYGFNFGSAVGVNLAVNNAVYNNTSGAWRISPLREIGTVTLTGVPFTNAAGHDFSLNNTASQGKACRAAGIPGAFPGGTTTGYLDIGAVQHADPAGGAAAAVINKITNVFVLNEEF